MANRFWVLDAGTWDNSDTTHWSTSSGGLGGASVPGSGDDVIFDANSCLLGGTVTPNYDMTVNSITMGAFTGTLDFSANNNSPTMVRFSGTGAGIRTLKLGSGTFSLSGDTTGPWSFSTTTNLTFDAGTSTIKFTSTNNSAIGFQGGSLTYYNLWWDVGAKNSTGCKINGSNVFNEFKDTGTNDHSILFDAGSTNHFSSFIGTGNGVGNLITISTNGSTSTHALVKDGGGTVSCDYLDIKHSVATPDFTWYAGLNSVNDQSIASAGSGWIFTRPESRDPGNMFLAM